VFGCAHTQAATWDPLPLARAILRDRYDAPPVALLAAWKCVYWDDPRELTELARAAANQAGAEEPATLRKELA
jgi:hypothetical protein